MSVDLPRRTKQIFLDAIERPDAEREPFLSAACGADGGLRARVDELLRMHDSRTQALDSPLARSGDDLPLSVGRYRVIRKLGEGGMGVVYEAQQDEPRRTVALKVLRSGILSNEILRRFRHESQILAQLQHSGIAQVYDAGTSEMVSGPCAADNRQTASPLAKDQTLPVTPLSTSTRVPFFAMEYIRGVPLTEFADRHALGPRERLALVAQVCDAVEYAHRKGVIHRDLKPANILVTDELQIADCRLQIGAGAEGRTSSKSAICNLQSAIPKILDFGVARLTGSDVNTVTVQTTPGQLVGTLPYMSPEQVSGDATQVDARTDVYALGVILYELLAKRLPLDITGRSLPEVLRRIRDDEPSRLSSINTLFRGDIDTIVAKALEKDRSRRYASAAELAADIRRYLRDEPIAARRAGTLYQFRKFTRRHPGIVFGTAATIAALTVGLLFAASMYLRAERQRQETARVAYRASLAAASSALQANDVATARRHLQTAPPELRGWEWLHLSANLDQSMLQITPVGALHGSQVVDFVDGGHVIEAFLSGEPRSLRRWDAGSGQLLAEVLLPDAAIHSHSHNGRASLRIHTDRIEVTDTVAATTVTHEIAHPRDGFHITSPTVSNNCRWLLCIIQDRFSMGVDTVRVDLSTGATWRPAIPPELQRGQVGQVADDGRVVCFAHESDAALVLNPSADSIELRGHSGTVSALALSAAAERIVTGSRDTTLRLWDARSGRTLVIGSGHTEAVTALTYRPDDGLIASASRDRTIRFWNAQTLEPVQVVHGHERTITRIGFHPDGRRLLSAGDDDTLRVWDASGRDPSVLRGHKSYVYPVVFSPDGRLLASGGWDHSVRLWNTATGELVRELTCDSDVVYDLAFSARGQRLAAICGPSSGLQLQARAWDVGSGQLLGAIDLDRPTMCCFAPDGSHIVWSYDLPSQTGRAWNVTTGTQASLSLSPGLLASVRSPSIAADGSLLAHVTLESDLLHLVVEDSAARRSLWKVPINWSRHFTFSPIHAGSMLRVAAPSGRERSVVIVWDAHSGAVLAELRGHTDEVFAVAWSPDGERIATGGRDQTIRIWDAGTYDELLRLRGHTAYIWSLAWSPDGAVLSSGSGDYTVRLWHTNTSRRGPGDPIARPLQ